MNRFWSHTGEFKILALPLSSKMSLSKPLNILVSSSVIEELLGFSENLRINMFSKHLAELNHKLSRYASY